MDGKDEKTGIFFLKKKKKTLKRNVTVSVNFIAHVELLFH